MLLLEIISWAWEHKGEITVNGMLLLILRKFILAEIHKTIHFGREEELEWILPRVEALTGETFSHQPILNQVRTRYIKRFYSYLRMVTKSANQLRRRKRMNQNINKAMFGPLISAIILIIKTATGYEIPIQSADLAIDCFLSVYTIYGYFIHPTGQPFIGQINKALLMPIFGSMGVIISLITHHAISTDLVSAFADFVIYGLTLWGQFMNPVRQIQTSAPKSQNFIQG